MKKTKKQNFSEQDHGADLALKVYGENFIGLLRNAAKGMYSLMALEEGQLLQNSMVITIGSADPESMLVDFLNELLFQLEKGCVLHCIESKLSPEGKANSVQKDSC